MSTSSIARRGLVVALAGVLVLATGCMKFKEETRITKEGTGTAVVTAVLDMSKLKSLKEMMEGMGMGGGGEMEDPLEDFDPEELKKELEGAEGVRLISATRTVDEEKQTTVVRIELEFDTLEALYRSGPMEQVQVNLEKLENGNYKFTRKMAGEMGAEEMDSPEAQQMMEAMMAMFEPFAADMEMGATLTFPTEIVETNGEKTAANTVTFKVGFKDLPKADKRTNWVVFKGEGLSWKPFATTPKAGEDEEGAEDDEEVEAPVTPGER